MERIPMQSHEEKPRAVEEGLASLSEASGSISSTAQWYKPTIPIPRRCKQGDQMFMVIFSYLVCLKSLLATWNFVSKK